MRVTKNSLDKVELIKRVADDGKRFYTAFLYDHFVEHRQEAENGLLLSYECDMVGIPEFESKSDSAALSYIKKHFNELWIASENLEVQMLKRKASDDAKAKLAYFDYVDHKTWEMFLKGATLEEIREWLKKDKGITFLEDRENLRRTI